MIPQECAERIILNDPSLAEPLLDLLLWAIRDGVRDSDEFDEVQDILFLKLPAYREARERYVRDRAA